MIEVRFLQPAELEYLCDLDVSEESDVVLKMVGDEVVETHKHWMRPRWSEDECSKRIGYNRTRMVEEKRSVIGASDNDMLVGLITFRPHLSPGMSELAGL
jgi:hypothetical protein